MSLALIAALGVRPETPAIDVGGGNSLLVDHLLERGFADVTVLDVSSAALAQAQQRVGEAPVTWLEADVCGWRPERTYGLWHDRAVFHFLVNPADRAAYLDALWAATAPGAAVIIGAFAQDGPESCSGLPVARYSADGLASVVGGLCEVTTTSQEQHTTPGGDVQPFTWLAARRRAR